MFSRPQSHYHLRRSNSSLESKALADFRHQLFEVEWLDWPYNKSEIDIIFKIMDDGCMPVFYSTGAGRVTIDVPNTAAPQQDVGARA